MTESEERESASVTENLIEIVLVYADLSTKYPKLKDCDLGSWKEKFIGWAEGFERFYPDPEYWSEHSYQDAITEFAAKNIMKFAEITWLPFYFTFGDWDGFPYRNTYLIVYATDKYDAVKKFREYHEDANLGVINCSGLYTQEWVDKLITSGEWNTKNKPDTMGDPVEIIV